MFLCLATKNQSLLDATVVTPPYILCPHFGLPGPKGVIPGGGSHMMCHKKYNAAAAKKNLAKGLRGHIRRGSYKRRWGVIPHNLNQMSPHLSKEKLAFFVFF